MMLKGPFREFVPIGPLTVRIRLEAGRKPRGVKLLVAGGVPNGEERGGGLSVTIPVVRDHEVVAVDF
jgi:hypothetical protein